MKKLFKALALCLLLALVAGAAVAEAPQLTLEPVTVWLGDKDIGYPIDLLGAPEGAKVEIVSVKSAKKKILKARIDYEDEAFVSLKGLKAGKSKVTVNYTVDGEAGSASRTYAVKKYPNPFAALTVNGKKVKFKRDPFFRLVNNFTGTETKISYKLAKNWAVDSVNSFYGPKVVDDPTRGTAFTWENGQPFSIPAGNPAAIGITLRQKKTGDLLTYDILYIPEGFDY